MQLVKILKALADENRLHIIHLLAKRTLCVCEIEPVFSMNQSNVSRHLQKLKDAGLIDAEKKGQYVYYSISKEAEKEYPFFKRLREQIAQQKIFPEDGVQGDSRGCS